MRQAPEGSLGALLSRRFETCAPALRDPFGHSRSIMDAPRPSSCHRSLLPMLMSGSAGTVAAAGRSGRRISANSARGTATSASWKTRKDHAGRSCPTPVSFQALRCHLSSGRPAAETAAGAWPSSSPPRLSLESASSDIAAACRWSRSNSRAACRLPTGAGSSTTPAEQASRKSTCCTCCRRCIDLAKCGK